MKNPNLLEHDRSTDLLWAVTHLDEEFVTLIARNINSRAKMIHVSPWLALLLARLIGRMVGDVMITKDEIAGLMSNLLVSESPPAGHTRLSEWLEQNGNSVGAFLI